MKNRLSLLFCVALVIFCASTPLSSAQKRGIPKPLEGHPGNVFLEGEDVAVKLPQSDGFWRLINYDDRVVCRVNPDTNGVAQLGKLPVGFYRLIRTGDSNWVSLAVLKPLKSPTPLSSPIALDVAMAWFYPKEKMSQAANLAALAGVNWVRDRLNWAEMEPERGKFSGWNRYDDSAKAQTEAGLQVLQVNHISPRWANPQTRRFPVDLRDAYRFYMEMAKRWRNTVGAIEPWNEADIPNFGGHTGAEMASMQKASYLGIKKGNPKTIACLNVFAVHNLPQLLDLAENETAPYFDTYNFHHYEPYENYPKLYADHRMVSAGKPLWVTEAAMPVRWSGDPNLKELSDENLKLQSERLVKTFACALNENPAALFYFLLPHYVEGQVQFGLLRPDLTPRAGYCALAACGRLLADARPLGRWKTENSNLYAYMFDTQPDGISRETMVLWSSKGTTEISLPSAPIEIYDHIGRKNEVVTGKNLSFLKVGTAPVFVIFAKGASQKFALEKSPQATPVKTGKISPVVLQARWAQGKVDLKNSAYKIPTNAVSSIPISVYNFSDKTVKGKFSVHAPEGWTAVLPADIQVAPMEKKDIVLNLRPAFSKTDEIGVIKIEGEFGNAGRPVLSFRCIADK